MQEFPNDYYRGGSEILALLCQDHSRFAVCRVFRHWIYRAAVTAQASPQWNIWAWRDKIDTALSLSANSARQIQPVFKPRCNCTFKPHTLAASQHRHLRSVQCCTGRRKTAVADTARNPGLRAGNGAHCGTQRIGRAHLMSSVSRKRMVRNPESAAAPHTQ